MAITIINSQTAKEKYPVRPGFRTASGNATRDCDDVVARSLRGTGMQDWLEIADKNGVRDNLQKLIDAGKNTGQVRMALGRMLRTFVTAHNTDPEKHPMPYLPEAPAPKLPTPVKAADADPKPEPEGDASEDSGEEGDAEEEN